MPIQNSDSVSSTQSESGFKRVLSLWDLVLFGIAFVGPTAPYALFGIVTTKSHGHIPLVYLIAMVAMSFTAISYGRMAVTFPESGSTYAFASKALHPNIGYFAGWGMILDYILIPLLSIIYVSLMASQFVPEVPYVVWVVITTLLITAINLRGIEMTARANVVMNAIMITSLVWFMVVAIRALLHGTGEAKLLSLKPFYNPESFLSTPRCLPLPWPHCLSWDSTGSALYQRTRRMGGKTSRAPLYLYALSLEGFLSFKPTWDKWYGRTPPHSPRWKQLSWK